MRWWIFLGLTACQTAPHEPSFAERSVYAAGFGAHVDQPRPGMTSGAVAPRHPPRCPFNIGYSADGNRHDYDDVHASAMALALIAQAQLQHCLVHFDYNNHLGLNDAGQAADHADSVLGTAQRFGFDLSVFFDNQVDPTGSVANATAAIDAATPYRRFVYILGGPMEVGWQAIDAAADVQEPLVTVVSHHAWNDTHVHGPPLTHTWADILADFDVVEDHLGGWPGSDQNQTAWKSAPADWAWLLDVPNGDWLYDRLVIGSAVGDASDAGMVHWMLYGNRTATMAEIQDAFGYQQP